MKKLMIAFCLIGLLTISCIAKNKRVNNYDFSLVNKKIQAWIDSGYYHGAGLFIARNNRVILNKFYGNYTADTVIYIASSGKWLAAATIAAIVDEGKLSWDDPVKKWLPEFNDVKGNATLRQLLSHTAGFPDYQPQGRHRDDYQTLKESVANIVGLPADTIPGTKFSYGGLAMQVAGRMAELATGKDWETLFQEKIARPIGMKNTHFTPVHPGDGHSPMLGGGARTTLNDYASFLKMIFNNGVFSGKQILTGKSIREMQSDQIGIAKFKSPEYVEHVRAEMHHGIYGLGEWREELDSTGNAILISSPSWSGAYPWIDKTTNTYGFFIAHVDVNRANQDGFSSFYNSPVLPTLVRDVYKEAEFPDSIKTGFVNIGDAKLYYQESGHDEPVIFVHGHSFDHSEWDPQVKALASKYRVITYDCRGYGRSSSPIEGKEFLHANDLVKLMDNLNIPKAHLVGLSLGGFIVADMLALYQNRVLTATAASGDIVSVPGPDQPMAAAEVEKRRTEIETLKINGPMTQKWDWLKTQMTVGGTNLQKIKKTIWNMIYKWDQWQSLHIESRTILGNSVVEKLKNQKITVPVMVLTGEVDYNGPRELNKCVPSAIQRIVPNAGHVSNLENPEAFSKLIEEFINREIK